MTRRGQQSVLQGAPVGTRVTAVDEVGRMFKAVRVAGVGDHRPWQVEGESWRSNQADLLALSRVWTLS